MKNYAIVELIWHDACTRDGWFDLRDDLKDESAQPCFSTGYLLKMDKDTITVCHTMSGDGGYCGSMNIPKVWLKKIKVLRKVSAKLYKKG